MSRPLLLATDLGEEAETLLTTAADLARRLDHELVALRVVPEDELAAMRAAAPAESGYIDQILARLEEELDDRVREVADVPAHHVVVVRGEPADEILRVADERRAAMVVLGVRSRSRVGKLLFGSVAQPVLLQAPCPVLAVPV